MPLLLRRASGPFDIAAEPVIGPREVARVLGGGWLPARIAPVRALVWPAWRLRLVAADPGWLDIATSVPVMSTARAAGELAWKAEKDGVSALAEAVRGVAERASSEGSPHLRG